jgi:hypothetical protein
MKYTRRILAVAVSSLEIACCERTALPPAFTYTQARAAGISAERLYAYRAQVSSIRLPAG